MRTRELVAAGMTRSQIAWAVGAGRLIRIRIGHYCLPGLDEPTIQAIRVGGRLACVSELERLDVWVTHPPVVPHVHLLASASRLRGPGSPVRRLRPEECVPHWNELGEPPTDARVAVHDALRQAMGCLGELDAAASVESAVRLGLARLDDLRRRANARERAILSRVDGRADSGLETIVREPLRDARLRVEPQYRFAGLGQLDLLVEGFVAVELDGRRFHSGVVAPRDRRRDAVVASHGLTPLRFDYAQVVYDLPSVIRAIAGAVVAHRNVRGSGRRRALRLLRTSAARIS
jgi:very-short-patch-repair endonuclease